MRMSIRQSTTKFVPRTINPHFNLSHDPLTIFEFPGIPQMTTSKLPVTLFTIAPDLLCPVDNISPLYKSL